MECFALRSQLYSSCLFFLMLPPFYILIYRNISQMGKLRHAEIFVPSPGSCVGGKQRLKVLIPPAEEDEPLCLLRGAVH